jgi:hypothetical protein
MRLFVSSFVLTISLIAAAFTTTARSDTARSDKSSSNKTDVTSSDTDPDPFCDLCLKRDPFCDLCLEPDPLCDTCWVSTEHSTTAISITDLTNTMDTSVTSSGPHSPPELRWPKSTIPKVFPIPPLSTSMTSTADGFSTRAISMTEVFTMTDKATVTTETASITSYIETGSDIEAATTDTSGT